MLSKMQKTPWQDTATYAAHTENTLTNASVGIQLGGAGFPVNTTVGFMKVTWYVTFRGQAY
jgi:hypothetical protein